MLEEHLHEFLQQIGYEFIDPALIFFNFYPKSLCKITFTLIKRTVLRD